MSQVPIFILFWRLPLQTPQFDRFSNSKWLILGKVRVTSRPGVGGGGAQENLGRGGQGRGGGGQFPSDNGANVPPAPGNGEGRNRTKLKPSETEARLNERPNTVVIDGYESEKILNKNPEFSLVKIQDRIFTISSK